MSALINLPLDGGNPLVLGEPWEILISCQDLDGSALTADRISDVKCRISGSADLIADLSLDDGVEVIDGSEGVYLVTVSQAAQALGGALAAVYDYQIIAVRNDGVTVGQSMGALSVSRNLFA